MDTQYDNSSYKETARLTPMGASPQSENENGARSRMDQVLSYVETLIGMSEHLNDRIYQAGQAFQIRPPEGTTTSVERQGVQAAHGYGSDIFDKLDHVEANLRRVRNSLDAAHSNMCYIDQHI